MKVKSEKLETSNNNQTQTQTKTPTYYYQNKEIESFIESNYVSIKDRETKVFEFLANRTRVVEKPDFNGKPTKRVQFVVIDVNDTERRREKLFEVSRMHVAKIYEELKNGKTVLEISRTGQNKDTRYFIRPVR